jgi:hypothetical protein
MKTKLPSSSHHHQQCSLSPDTENLIRNFRRSQMPGIPQPAFAGACYQVDSTSLDLRAVLPGAQRELGPAHLQVVVDSETGRIVEAVVLFGADATTPKPTEHRYRPGVQSAAERALRRLLRPDNPN